MSSRLAQSGSAYLRSAAHQPIDWYPWGEEPFAEAERLRRPVLLDIGAVWCHWCHVMDQESYDDPALADLLNDRFICIKVDRDERPDVDARYQRAVQAMTGQGGWPLTVFLTPGGQAFYGGTYFPPDRRYGRPSFRMVLESVAEAFRERPDQVAAQADTVRQAVRAQLDESAPGTVHQELLDRAAERMAAAFDRAHGGFGSHPKFPHPAALRFLLTRWSDRGEPEPLTMVEATLRGMGRGGIFDQLGGGFHRYSVDAKWVVPHFEKMSYDNAELLRIYLDAHAATGNPEYAAVARGIVGWIRQVLADPAGGYGASQDADNRPGDDGDYFTWTRAEAAAVLEPEHLEVAGLYYDIGTAGEMPHDPARNVLFVAASVERIAATTGRSAEAVGRLLTEARARLLAARSTRPEPVVDRTRYTGWNAMLCSALLRAGAVLEDRWAHEHALLSLQRIRAEAAQPDAVGHVPGGEPGWLEDQVHTAAAALDAWEATGQAPWRSWAEALMERAWRDHHAEAGGLFDRAAAVGPGFLSERARPIQDTPTPSANAVAGLVCARLEAHTGSAIWRDRAEEIGRAFAGAAAELSLYGGSYLLCLDWLLRPPTHLVVVGPADDPAAAAMHRNALAAWRPRAVVQRLTPEAAAAAELPAALRAMVSAGREARGYLCVGTSCRTPAPDEAAWAALLAEPPA